MKTLYLECTSGISGDMTVAALLDLGADPEALRAGLASLGVEGYTLEIGRVKKSGIDACDFHVHLTSQPHHGDHHDHSHSDHHDHSHGDHHDHSHNDHHDHPHNDHPPRHHHGKGPGHGRGCGRGHGHGCRQNQEHASLPELHGHPPIPCDHPHHDPGHGDTHPPHPHSNHSHSHDHIHRNLGDILAILDRGELTPRAKTLARRIFTVVAEAEAAVHGLPLEEVHFHEVGAVDSIVDIVGTAICIDNLGIERVLCSPLHEGTGTVTCQHGVMPVPAPATMEIVRRHRIPLVITDNIGEMVTPTGAAIAAALADAFGRPGAVTIAATGYGAGKKELRTANLLRAMLVKPVEAASAPGDDEVLLLECNLDDITGEHLAHACERLLASGALDVWCTPILMKKSRPAQLLSVLCHPAEEETMTALLFQHTSTIGVRVSHRRRHVMERGTRTVETPHGPLTLKDCTWRNVHKTTVEYESARKISESCNIPIDAVYRLAYNEKG